VCGHPSPLVARTQHNGYTNVIFYGLRKRIHRRFITSSYHTRMPFPLLVILLVLVVVALVLIVFLAVRRWL
jgi:hypothetical protein